MTRTRAYIPSLFLAALLAFTLFPGDGKAQSFAVDISKHNISITTSFVGSDLLLFGTTGGKGDVIVVVRGPHEKQVVRRKEQIAGIWVNKDNVTFTDIPSFYEIISNKPIDQILPDEELARLRIGLNHIDLTSVDTTYNAETVADFRAALIRGKKAKNLYSSRENGIFFVSPALFRADVRFPVNVKVGSYKVDTYLVKNGEITAIETTPIPVKKVGFEAEVYNFAHRQSLAYGILAVVIAVMAGWLASVVFRKA